MKYMTFNSSCSYAGLANLLALHGVDTEDAAIALDIGLPYMMDVQDGCYLAGAMLQGSRWFSLFLLPRGFRVEETRLPRRDVPAWLTGHAPAMLGLRISEQAKHAVVCTGYADGKLRFINSKRADTNEPDTLLLTAEELLLRLDASVMLASLHPCAPEQPDTAALRRRSIKVFRQYSAELMALCRQALPKAELLRKLNTHFRPLLVDEIAMMGLIGEGALAAELTQVQQAFLNALHGEAEALCLADVLPMDVLSQAINKLEKLLTSAEDFARNPLTVDG